MEWFIRVYYKNGHELDVYLPVDVEAQSYYDGYIACIRHLVDSIKEPKRAVLFQNDKEKAITYF